VDSLNTTKYQPCLLAPIRALQSLWYLNPKMATRTENASEYSNSIYRATVSCGESFEQCRLVPALIHDGWAENRLLDFNLWASGVGAFAVPPAGLDYRLQDQPDVRAVVVGLLVTLRVLVQGCGQYGTFAQSSRHNYSPTIGPGVDIRGTPSGIDCIEAERLHLHREDVSTDESDPFAPWSDESSLSSDDGISNTDNRIKLTVLEQSKADADSILDQIIRLGVLIRSSSSASRLNKADAYFGYKDYLNLHRDDSERSSKLPIKDLRELKAHLLACLFRSSILPGSKGSASYKTSFESDFDGLDAGHRKALDCLIYANLRRRNRFWYARRHGQKLATAQTVLFPEEPKVYRRDETNMARATARSRHDEIVSAQEMGNQSMTTGTAASNDKVEPDKLEGLAGRSQGQHTMSRASVSLKKSGWPHPPRLSDERKTFRCPCCYLTLSSMEAERWYWRYV
jgi:hypothetical protein